MENLRMAEMTVPVSREKRTSIILRSPRSFYVPGVREPYRLPKKPVRLPAPPRLENPPPKYSWQSLIAPLAMVSVMVGVSIFSSNKSNTFTNPLMLVMYAVGAISPIVGGINYFFQKKAYKKSLEQRERAYKYSLEQEKRQIESLIQKQRNVLVYEYPGVKSLINIALSKGAKPRLWWRRADNKDFLSVRIGVSKGKPSFPIETPDSPDQSDPLFALPQEIAHEFRYISNLPFLIDFKKVGSLGVGGREFAAVYGATRRLLLDILIHHSPDSVQIAVLSDIDDAAKLWEWLKWAPHTQAIQKGEQIRKLAFHTSDIKEFLVWMSDEIRKRSKTQDKDIQVGIDYPAIVVVVDDRGKLRQSADIKTWIRQSKETGIYFIFVRGHHLPGVGARLDVSDQGYFRYAETWENGISKRGKAEFISIPESEMVARSLSTIDLLGAATRVNLPSTVRISNVLETTTITKEAIQSNWDIIRTPRELLQFPIGVQTGRDGLEQTFINLLPSKFNGEDAYHSLLIGTTGSGKSEFMKSLVLGAAYQYSPTLLKFFFLDFKGGAAFDVFKNLPHVVGVVTNLRPELVLRGLDAIQSEIERRQQLFADSGVTNIWDFNIRNTRPMAHMLLLLDEFAAGLDQFPTLADILDLLVRQGRSLGMYLLLANQDVNPTVEKLLTNIGWRIALKVAQREEMGIIDKNLPIAKRAGQGYLRSLNGEINEFQGAYAGFPVVSSVSQNTDEFKIYRIDANGKYIEVYDHTKQNSDQPDVNAASPTEENVLIKLMEEIAREKGIKNEPIYLDPLAERFMLGDVISDGEPFRTFSPAGWTDNANREQRLSVPVGYYDLPQKCIQRVLQIDFNDQDGHLWIVGSPGSGVTLSLETTISSLVVTHSPADIALYILEFGSGKLLAYGDFPHTGAVIRPMEQERIERLFKFLNREMEYRANIGYTKTEEQGNGPISRKHISPNTDIFLIINNFNELKSINFDWVDTYINRYVQSGKSMGIHLIITSSGGSDLPRKISSKIARRLVLKVSKDEYMEITGHKVLPLNTSAKGRGYWVDPEFGIAECQIAQPEFLLSNALESTQAPFNVAHYVKERWQGKTPPPIGTIPSHISLAEIVAQFHPQNTTDRLEIPFGLSYETLDIVGLNMLAELPHWFILGPKRSGKTNFLACMIQSLLLLNNDISINVFALRPRNPLQKRFKDTDTVQFYTMKNAVDGLDNILTVLDTSAQTPSETFIFVDDIGAIFASGNDKIRQKFNEFGTRVRDMNSVYLFVTGLPDELRTGPAVSDGFIKLLKQSDTGIAFLKDMMILDWFGVTSQMIRPYNKMEFGVGRGFLIRAGKAQLIQTPCIE